MRRIRQFLRTTFRQRAAAVTVVMLVAALATLAVQPWSHGPVSTVEIADEPQPTIALPSPAASPADPVSSPSASPSPSPGAGSSGADTPHVWYRHASLSRDARIVAYTIMDALYDGEPRERPSDVFVRNHSTHRTSRASIGLNGAAANGASDNPVVSADGTCVAFVSEASNLVSGDTNRTLDVFVRDIVEHTTVRVSVSTDGRQGNGPSGSAPNTEWSLGRGTPAISSDCRYVSFESQASNLVDGDTNERSDVFVHDLESGETVAVSVSRDGSIGNAASGSPSISADGRIVAFQSEATSLTTDVRPPATRSGVFARDLRDGTTALASVSSGGEWLPEWNGWPSIAGSGRVVAFINIPNLFDDAPEPIIEDGGDIVRRDLDARTTTHVNPPYASYHMRRVALSADGGVTAYVHLIGGMDPFCNLLPPETRGGYLGSCDREWLSVSPDGRYVAFGASMDALSDPEDEKRFGGDLGAMIYDRATDEFVAAWKW